MNLVTRFFVSRFADIEILEAVGFVTSKIREAISEVEFSFGARNSDKEDANFFVSRVARMADEGEVAWEFDEVAVAAGVRPVFVVGSD